jgi:hypothetical protein
MSRSTIDDIWTVPGDDRRAEATLGREMRMRGDMMASRNPVLVTTTRWSWDMVADEL